MSCLLRCASSLVHTENPIRSWIIFVWLFIGETFIFNCVWEHLLENREHFAKCSLPGPGCRGRTWQAALLPSPQGWWGKNEEREQGNREVTDTVPTPAPASMARKADSASPCRAVLGTSGAHSSTAGANPPQGHSGNICFGADRARELWPRTASKPPCSRK